MYEAVLLMAIGLGGDATAQSCHGTARTPRASCTTTRTVTSCASRVGFLQHRRDVRASRSCASSALQTAPSCTAAGCTMPQKK